MNYIVLDLEWNQPNFKLPDTGQPQLKSEIIQIGAVKLNEAFEEMDRFKALVKLSGKRKLNKHVSSVTGITAEDIATGESFVTVIERFKSWFGDTSVFVTWGCDDKPVLIQNLKYYGLGTEWTDQWLNAQLIYGIQNGIGKNQVSLSNAMEAFGIEQTVPFHDALNDAYYTSEVLKKLDIPAAMEEYDKIIAGNKGDKKPLSNKFFRGFINKSSAFFDKRISEPFCPKCDHALENKKPWGNISGDKYITIATCPEHGDFAIIVKFKRAQNGRWNAIRLIYTATEGKINQYEHSKQCSQTADAQ